MGVFFIVVAYFTASPPPSSHTGVLRQGESSMADLSGKHIVMIVDNYIEEAELVEPKEALEAAGATVDIIASKGGNVQTMQNDVEMASTQEVDHTFDDIPAFNNALISMMA
jgi:putative intracellular protease/amidase